MMKTKIMFGLALVMLINIKALAQDINFMFYSNTSLIVNPGVIASGDDFIVAANYKNKSYVNDVHVQSTFLMISRPLYKNETRFGGIGLAVISDKGGDVSQLINEGILGSYAHEIQLNSWSRLSLGIQASYILKRIDTKEFSTGNQWVEGLGYDPSMGNGEEFERLTTGNFTINSGLFWYVPNDDQSIKFHIGFAMYNLTKPNYSFFNAQQREPIKYIASSAYEIYSEGRFTIEPQLLYYNSYNQNNWTIGSKWAYKFNVSDPSWYLSSGSIDLLTAYQLSEGAMIGIQINQTDFSFGIAYGLSDNYSNQFAPDKGAVEVSFTFRKLLYKKPKEVRKIYVSEEGYYDGQIRDIAFKETEKSEVINTQKLTNDEMNSLKNEPEREVKFKLQKDFNFGFNEAELNKEAKSYIDDIVLLLNTNTGLKIEIIGHTDNVGTRDANQTISERRSDVVKDYLVQKGIDINRIKTSGMADTKPLNKNNTDADRSVNRRVEFVIYY